MRRDTRPQRRPAHPFIGGHFEEDASCHFGRGAIQDPVRSGCADSLQQGGRRLVFDPGDEACRLPVDVQKLSCHQDETIPLQGHAADETVRARPHIEVPIQGPVPVQAHDVFHRLPAKTSECASHHDLPVCLEREGPDVGIGFTRPRIETLVQDPIGMKPHQTRVLGPLIAGEKSPDQDLPVRLHRDHFDRAVQEDIGLRPRNERRVEGAVRVEAAKTAVVGIVVQPGEHAADEDFSIRLHGQRRHIPVVRESGERRVQTAVLIQPGDAAAERSSVELEDRTADQDFPVRLRHQDLDPSLHIRNKCRVQRPVCVQPG